MRTSDGANDGWIVDRLWPATLLQYTIFSFKKCDNNIAFELMHKNKEERE